jgi:hypothetical protein
MSKLLIPFDRPIAFLPSLAKVLGGIPEAIYLQQLYYWSDKGIREDGFVYKSKTEIENETTLTRDQQDRVRLKLTKRGILEVKKEKANGTPTLHYKINLIVLSACLETLSEPLENGVDFGLAGNPLMEKRETHDSSIYIEYNRYLFDHWNSKKNTMHHRMLVGKTDKKLTVALKQYTVEEIVKAIDTYDEVIGSPLTYWNYKWTLLEFLQRGLERFSQTTINDYLSAGKSKAKVAPKSDGLTYMTEKEIMDQYFDGGKK